MTADSTLPCPYAGPETFRASIFAALHRVVDPELALSIVDVGLIHGIDVDAQRIHAAITMTSVACPVGEVSPCATSSPHRDEPGRCASCWRCSSWRRSLPASRVACCAQVFDEVAIFYARKAP